MCSICLYLSFFLADGLPMIFHWLNQWKRIVQPVHHHIIHNLRLKLTLWVPEHHTITPKILQLVRKLGKFFLGGKLGVKLVKKLKNIYLRGGSWGEVGGGFAY